MEDSVEELLVFLQKLLRELHSTAFSAGKRNRADLIEVATTEIGEVVSGTKKTLAKDVGTKIFRR